MNAVLSENSFWVSDKEEIEMGEAHVHHNIYGNADSDAAELTKMQPDEENFSDLAELFKMFGDLTRIQILYVLLDEEMSVGDIAERLEMNTSAISHQLRVLKQAKLIKNRRAGKNMFYSLADNHVVTIMKMGLDHILE